MVKRRTLLLAALVIAGLFLTILAISAQGASARTITVDDSGGKDYVSIQAAVNAASAGDTVYVYNGTYNETVAISNSITIIGESNESTILSGTPAEEGALSLSYGFHITANRVNISKIKIDDFWNGIYLDYSSNCAIISNTIANSHYGFYLVESSNNNIAQNTITNTREGLYLRGGSNNSMTLNTITDCYEFGIYICYGSNRNSIDANTIVRCGDSGIEMGDCLSNTVTANTIKNTTNGIYLRGSSNNFVSENLFLDNTGHGTVDAPHAVLLEYSHSNKILNNTARNSNSIRLTGCWNNTIIGNLIQNGYDGIHLDVSSSNKVSANTIKNMSGILRGYGIYLTSSNDNSLEANIIRNVSLFGILLEASSNNVLSRNDIYGCGKDGINIDNRSSGNTNLENTMGDTYNRTPGFEALALLPILAAVILLRRRRRNSFI